MHYCTVSDCKDCEKLGAVKVDPLYNEKKIPSCPAYSQIAELLKKAEETYVKIGYLIERLATEKPIILPKGEIMAEVITWQPTSTSAAYKMNIYLDGQVKVSKSHIFKVKAESVDLLEMRASLTGLHEAIGSLELLDLPPIPVEYWVNNVPVAMSLQERDWPFESGHPLEELWDEINTQLKGTIMILSNPEKQETPPE